MRNISTEDFRAIDNAARQILNSTVDEATFESLEEMTVTLDSMQDYLESYSIETGDGRASVLRSTENFELIEARVCQLLLIAAQAGGWNKMDDRERLWQ